VHEFVERADLDELLPHLPASNTTPRKLTALHPPPDAIPRDLGKVVLQKMITFLAHTQKIYQDTSTRLDSAHALVADGNRLTYLTLEQIADIVLPPRWKSSMEKPKFRATLLYAVHRTLMRDDISFRLRGDAQANRLYEVSSLDQVKTLNMVRELVRQHTEDDEAEKSPSAHKKITKLELFAIRARKLIDKSRRTRSFTPYGTISPWTNDQRNDFREGQALTLGFNYAQSQEFNKIIDFMEMWTALDIFTSNSVFRGIGAVILRCVGRYQEAPLDRTTGFTFLQEIGAIPPWQSLAPYTLRLNDTGRILPLASPKYSNTQGFTEDKIAHLRKDWEGLPVYCIDDALAGEIDDGISVEKTDVPGQYWIHVHVADPAAHIDPQSDVAKIAQSSTETIYWPERILPMLQTEFSQANLSLANDRPCLTFSTKMNINGDVLDYKIIPGKVHDVIYLTPATVEEAISGAPPKSSARQLVHQVGPDSAPKTPTRPLHESHELLDVHKDDLRILQKLGVARLKQFAQKGGVFLNDRFPSPFVSVSFGDDAPLEQQDPEETTRLFRHAGDPTIQISCKTGDELTRGLSLPPNPYVMAFMLTAGEVAARWCHDRGIPAPFRVTPRNPDHDPYDFYLKNVLPSQDKNGIPDEEKLNEYVSMVGKVQLSTTPGPHALIGLDMFARCTSPLRRYVDMLLHWQVEGALLEESRTGHSLVGNTKDDFLPFTKDQIESLLPHIDSRTREIKRCQKSTNRHWVLHYLVRAWRFKQAEIPATLPFRVDAFDNVTGLMLGTLTPFLTRALCAMPDWTVVETIKVGDLLEVELTKIDIPMNSIDVKSIRKLESV
jgi:hypothetical protein